MYIVFDADGGLLMVSMACFIEYSCAFMDLLLNMFVTISSSCDKIMYH